MDVEILNLIGNICSIFGLLIAIYLTSQVISIKNTIKDSSINKTTQKKNTVKNGDLAGRDINK